MSRDLLPGPHDRAPIDRRRVCDVVMERIVLANRWASEQWSLLGVVPGESGRDDEPRVLREDARSSRWLYPGFPVELFPDEAEGCYLNLVAERPFVFVNWEPTDGRPRVRGVTEPRGGWMVVDTSKAHPFRPSGCRGSALSSMCTTSRNR